MSEKGRVQLKKKVLFIGDAASDTGFARCTHAVCDAMHESGKWDVHIIGINYLGDPHKYPYKIYPAGRPMRGEDAFGQTRSGPITEALKPDIIVLLNDPWNIPEYVRKIRSVDENVPIIGWLAVDGKNCRGSLLNGLNHAVFWTDFAQREAKIGGMKIPSSVIGLGVDTSIFKPRDKMQARKELGFPEDKINNFIIGVVGRNQPRKCLDLTLEYFSTLIYDHGLTDVSLFMHVAPTGDMGWNLPQLAKYYKLDGRCFICAPDVGLGVIDEQMVDTYAALDVYWSTTQGEGWGLPALEAMACGTPCVLPDWSAFGEWAKGFARLVPCTSVRHTPNMINAEGGIVDKKMTVSMLRSCYNDRDRLSEEGMACHKFANKQRFSWEFIGNQYEHLAWQIISKQD